MKRWRCSVCNYVHSGEEPPDICPICGVGSEKFILIEEALDHIAEQKNEEKNQ